MRSLNQDLQDSRINRIKDTSAHVKRKCKTQRETEFCRKNSVSIKENTMYRGFRSTGLRRGFQLLPFVLLLVVSSAFAQFTAYEDLVPRYPQEMDGRVNMAKGRFSFAATDLVVPGRGLSLDFTRYYHGTAVSDRYRSYLGQG